MLVNTDEFYTKSLSLAQNKVGASGNDEAFLYRIVQKAGFGFPPEHSTIVLPNSNVTIALWRYRPVHGIHLSFNRGPGKKMCLSMNQETYKLLVSIEGLEEYRRVDRTVDRILSTTKAMVEEQTRHNMVTINGKCQPNDTKPKERNHSTNQQEEELKQLVIDKCWAEKYKDVQDALETLGFKQWIWEKQLCDVFLRLERKRKEGSSSRGAKMGVPNTTETKEEQAKTTDGEDPVEKMKADLKGQAEAKYYAAQAEKKKKEEEEKKKREEEVAKKREEEEHRPTTTTRNETTSGRRVLGQNVRA